NVMLSGRSPSVITPDCFAYVPCSWFVSTVMRYDPRGTGFWSLSNPSHIRSYFPAGRVARVTDRNWRMPFVRFHDVDRSGWYFELLHHSARVRTSLPDESSIQTATYGRFLERPEVSGRFTVTVYPEGQSAAGIMGREIGRSRLAKPEVRSKTPDSNRSAS